MEDLKDQKIANNIELIRTQNARDHLANERTLLAWIRTSVGIMAFGFVVVKFSFFIKQISFLLNKNAGIPNNGFSSVIGILLVAVGTITLVLSYVKYKQTEKQLSNITFQSSSTLILSLIISILIISLLLILYLINNTCRI